MNRIGIVYLSLIVGVFNVACSSGERGWAEFEVFADQDKQGQPVDCDRLLSYRFEKTYSELSDEAGFLDYIVDEGVHFSQCLDQINTMIKQYCTEAVSTFLVSPNSDGVRGYLRVQDYRFAYENKVDALCDAIYFEPLKSIDSPYKFYEGNRIIVLENSGAMVPVSTISQVTFTKGDVEQGRVWSISFQSTIETKSNTPTKYEFYYMYFGDEARWQKAKDDIGSAVSRYAF